MLTIGRFLLLTAQFLAGLLDFLKTRQCVAAGKAEAEASSLKVQLERAEKARLARRTVDLERLPGDDRFRRD
jgi:hypothetical protein